MTDIEYLEKIQVLVKTMQKNIAKLPMPQRTVIKNEFVQLLAKTQELIYRYE